MHPRLNFTLPIRRVRVEPDNAEALERLIYRRVNLNGGHFPTSTGRTIRPLPYVERSEHPVRQSARREDGRVIEPGAVKPERDGFAVSERLKVIAQNVPLRREEPNVIRNGPYATVQLKEVSIR